MSLVLTEATISFILRMRMPQVDNYLPDHVAAYQTFMEQYGQYGGWKAEDHSEFERILRACRGEYDLAVKICDEKLVGQDHDAVIAHARCMHPYNECGLCCHLSEHDFGWQEIDGEMV